MHRSKLTLSALMLSVIASLISCSRMPSIGFPGVYKINIQQGNVVKKELVDQLRVGMTKKQVRYVMGTPLVVDTFNQNRWDYFYSFKTGKGDHEQKKIVVLFDNDKLASFNSEITTPDSTAKSLKDTDDYENLDKPKSIWD